MIATKVDINITIDDAKTRQDRAWVVVEYHALNGQVFTLDHVQWYEMQEALNELSRLAYENDTAVKFVVIS